METIVSDSGILDGMKKEKTVPIYVRVPESDVATVDRVAADERETRSSMVARIIREWAKKQEKRK